MPIIFLYHIRHWKYRYEESSACSGRFQETAGDTDKKAWWQYVKYVRRQRFANPVTRTHRKSREVGGRGMLSAFHRHPSVRCLQRQTPSWVQEPRSCMALGMHLLTLGSRMSCVVGGISSHNERAHSFPQIPQGTEDQIRRWGPWVEWEVEIWDRDQS